MITRTSLSRLAVLSASSNPRTISARSVLYFSGRFSVIVAIAPDLTYFTTSSGIASLLVCCRRIMASCTCGPCCAVPRELAAFAGLIFWRTLAVIAERAVAPGHSAFDALGASAPHEIAAFGRIAHGSVEDRSEYLRALQTHIVVGLIDDQLHRGELRQRDFGQLFRQCRGTVVEFLERIGEIDQLHVGRLLAADPLAGQRVVFRLGKAEAVDPHAGEVATPDPRIGRSKACVMRGDDEVRAECHFGAHAEAPAVHLGDCGLQAAPQPHVDRNPADKGIGGCED